MFGTCANRYTGQATVEGAFLIPVIMLLLLLLLQPGIVLYDRMVMQSAAAEACRLLATRSDILGDSSTACEEYVRHRLGAIPQQENFHMHEAGCSWVITFEGNEESRHVTVCITNELKPLPLLDAGMQAFGLTNDRGALVQRVEVSQVVRSEWISESEEGINPYAWINRNKEDSKEG